MVRACLPTPGIIANDLQAQLAMTGLEAGVQVMESGAFIDSAFKGNEPLHLPGWHADFPDASNFLTCCLGENLHNFGDPYPDIYEPLVAAGQEIDPALRQGLFREVAAGIEANDVVTTWQAAGDACSPPHTGTGEGFAIYLTIFQQFVKVDTDCGQSCWK